MWGFGQPPAAQLSQLHPPSDGSHMRDLTLEMPKQALPKFLIPQVSKEVKWLLSRIGVTSNTEMHNQDDGRDELTETQETQGPGVEVLV